MITYVLLIMSPSDGANYIVQDHSLS